MGDEKFKNKIIHCMITFVLFDRSGLWTIGYKKQVMELKKI